MFSGQNPSLNSAGYALHGDAFMESAECLMELDRKPEVKKCHDETLVEIETANTETGIAMADKLDRMCGALNFFAGCVKSPIQARMRIISLASHLQSAQGHNQHPNARMSFYWRLSQASSHFI
ncbi:hypothetical protein COOONC_06114 [Cooperia oncophora]